MMMMAGGRPPSNPTVEIPSWDCLYLEDPTAHVPSPVADGSTSTNGSDAFSHYEKAWAALQRYLPSNRDDTVWAEDGCGYSEDFDVPVDAFSSDDFRMFDFKVKKCAVARSHDWTECPFAHPGEKARRRDPRKYHYSGVACPDFRRGACKRGEACEYAHGVFESWLHPSRYRTQPCKDGTHCRRRVCFFAHTPEQLRVLPNTASPDASPSRLGHDSIVTMGLFDSSPKSTLYSPPPSSPTTGSPPLSPGMSMSLNSVNQLSESVRRLQLNKIKLGLRLSASPPSWGLGMGSPRKSPTTQPGFMSLPSTPISAQAPPVISDFDAWGSSCEEEPAMERVESGKQLRERIYEKLVKENSLERLGRVGGPVGGAGRLFGWVEEPGN